MNKKILIYILLLVLGASFFNFINYPNSNEKLQTPKFSIEVSTNKTNYLEGESIWITLKFKNLGSSRDSVKYLHRDNIINGLIIKNSAGKIAERVKIETEPTLAYCNFEPGEEKIMWIRVDFDLGFVPVDSTKIHYYFPPDDYLVKFFINTGNFNGGKFNTVVSNTYNFKVENSLPEAFDELLEIRRQMNDYRLANPDELIEKMRAFQTKYINTPYESDMLINELSYSVRTYEDKIEKFERADLFNKIDVQIRKDLNSYNNSQLLFYYNSIAKHVFNNSSKGVNYISSMKSQYFGTKIKDFVDQILGVNKKIIQ